jgi:hypothetical protein
MYTKFLSEILKGRDHSGYLSVDETIILEQIFQKCDRKVCTGFMWLGSFEHGKGPAA